MIIREQVHGRVLILMEGASCHPVSVYLDELAERVLPGPLDILLGDPLPVLLVGTSQEIDLILQLHDSLDTAECLLSQEEASLHVVTLADSHFVVMKGN